MIIRRFMGTGQKLAKSLPLKPCETSSNIPSSIWTKVGVNLHQQQNHPLNILSKIIRKHFEGYQIFDSLSPIVSTKQNFDDLLFSKDHSGRARTDTYYMDQDSVLRTHTSAHQSDIFKNGCDSAVIIADVYRRY